MATTKRTRGGPKTIEIPAAMANRVTMCVHALEGIPDEKLRAVASLAPGERLRGLMPDGSTPASDKRLASVPLPTPLPAPLAQGVADLVRLTGLEEAAVVRHLLTSGLFWCGLIGYGRDSFEFLAEATMGKEGAAEFIGQATETTCAIEMEAAVRVADQREQEAKAAFPGDWPAQAEA